MQRYIILLSFNGTNYHGWQVQENTPKTVQNWLNVSLSKVLNETIIITGCGRTDTGVHAKEFYAHFDSNTLTLIEDKEKWIHRFNSVLPNDIAIQDLYKVTESANTRFDAIARTYQYFIHTIKDPFKTNLSCQLPGEYDIEQMNNAAKILLQHADFSSFSKSNTQTATNNCTIMMAKWEKEGNTLIFTIKADRFLRNMVRAIVGTLVEVGKGKLQVSDVKSIIESKSRSSAGMSMPACGLYLMKVDYPENYFIKS